MSKKEYYKTYMRKRREQLIERGICPVCGCRPILKNYSICEECKNKQKEYRNKIRGILENARQ